MKFIWILVFFASFQTMLVIDYWDKANVFEYQEMEFLTIEGSFAKLEKTLCGMGSKQVKNCSR